MASSLFNEHSQLVKRQIRLWQDNRIKEGDALNSKIKNLENQIKRKHPKEAKNYNFKSGGFYAGRVLGRGDASILKKGITQLVKDSASRKRLIAELRGDRVISGQQAKDLNNQWDSFEKEAEALDKKIMKLFNPHNFSTGDQKSWAKFERKLGNIKKLAYAAYGSLKTNRIKKFRIDLDKLYKEAVSFQRKSRKNSLRGDASPYFILRDKDGKVLIQTRIISSLKEVTKKYAGYIFELTVKDSKSGKERKLRSRIIPSIIKFAEKYSREDGKTLRGDAGYMIVYSSSTIRSAATGSIQKKGIGSLSEAKKELQKAKQGELFKKNRKHYFIVTPENKNIFVDSTQGDAKRNFKVFKSTNGWLVAESKFDVQRGNYLREKDRSTAHALAQDFNSGSQDPKKHGISK